jgi:4-alpha-glucanotransferase
MHGLTACATRGRCGGSAPFGPHRICPLRRQLAARPDLKPRYETFHRDNVHQRQARVLAQAARELAPEIDKACFAQFLLFRQADSLKQYAHRNDVRLVGDLPFFVAPDSSDVWARPELFLLNEEFRPRFVAGVPPDYFSKDGQRCAHVDVIRLDHFRAFAAAWHMVNSGESGDRAASGRPESRGRRANERTGPR